MKSKLYRQTSNPLKLKKKNTVDVLIYIIPPKVNKVGFQKTNICKFKVTKLFDKTVT